MRYQVPQFIEVEDKIFGPLTLKQFIYLAGGGGLCLLCFSLLPLYITFLLALPIMSLSVAFAFFEINGRPFIHATENAFSYFIGKKLYLWKPRTIKPNTSPQGMAKPGSTALPVPKLSESKLKDLSWSLNIKDRNQMGISSTQSRTGFEI